MMEMLPPPPPDPSPPASARYEEKALNFKDLRLKPGEKVVLLDVRQFGHNKDAQSDWQERLELAFAEAGQGDWDFRWVTLPAGDTALIVGIPREGDSPDADGLVPATIIAIAEEKWTVADFLASISDGRFFGLNSPEDCEIKRIVDAEPKDGQALLAYVEEGEVYDPATQQTAHASVNQGVIDSLVRDWDVRTYQITRPELYAAKLATYARRWDHAPSAKRGMMEAKRVSIQRQQENLLSYVFRPAVVKPVLDRFKTPGEAILALKKVPWTPKGNISKKKDAANPFDGIKYLAEEGLKRADTICWKTAPIEGSEEESPSLPSEPTPQEQSVEKPPAKPTIVYEDNAKPIDESFRERSPQQEAKLLAPVEPAKKSLTPEKIEDKITDKDIEGV